MIIEVDSQEFDFEKSSDCAECKLKSSFILLCNSCIQKLNVDTFVVEASSSFTSNLLKYHFKIGCFVDANSSSSSTLVVAAS